MGTSELIWILVLVIIIVAWIKNFHYKDCAVHAARSLCERHAVQLLDETVGLVALKLRRSDGRIVLERHYTFEVSVTGADRLPGRLWLHHGQLAGATGSWLAEIRDDNPVLREPPANRALRDNVIRFPSRRDDQDRPD